MSRKGLAILLRRHKMSETSLITRWCVNGVGLMSAVAKGARNPKSKFLGKLDVFYLAEIMWKESSKSDLHILQDVEIRNYYSGLRDSYAATLCASYFSLLVERVLEAGLNDDPIVPLLDRAFSYLEKTGGTTKGLLHFESELAKMMGVASAHAAAKSSLIRTFGPLPKIREEVLTLVS